MRGLVTGVPLVPFLEPIEGLRCGNAFRVGRMSIGSSNFANERSRGEEPEDESRPKSGLDTKHRYLPA